MKVFISWSGQRSNQTARLLYDWLPQIINEIEPWMSDEDIKTGGDWSDAIKVALNEAVFGIICVTPGNKSREWLLFEAGALSRQVSDSTAHVAPFLIGFEDKSELRYPLARFQATMPTKSDMRKLLTSINTLAQMPRTDKQIDNALDVFWPRFEEEFTAIRDSVRNQPSHRRTDHDLLQEILSIARSLDKRTATTRRPNSPGFRLALGAGPKDDSWQTEFLNKNPYLYSRSNIEDYLSRILSQLADKYGFEVAATDYADDVLPKLTLTDIRHGEATANKRLRDLHAAILDDLGVEFGVKVLE